MSGDVAKIVLVPHERSHPFARRECVVREPLKVGRSVDKKRISTNNLIFDCRVLSRNHAVIRFENGKVSSNTYNRYIRLLRYVTEFVLSSPLCKYSVYVHPCFYVYLYTHAYTLHSFTLRTLRAVMVHL